MKFSLVFAVSNHSIDFEVVNNGDILGCLVEQAIEAQANEFSDNQVMSRKVLTCVNDITHSVSLSNTVLGNLGAKPFPTRTDLLEYLDQRVLNSLHEQWVRSQALMFDIDQLRFCEHSGRSRIGWKLWELYPDHIRKVALAEIMTKLGYIVPYEDINMGVHRLEHLFMCNTEYCSVHKWKTFENPFVDSMISNHDVVNFSLSYTYVGRQMYNRWEHWDTELEFTDHYNFETLEHAFQLNLARPQTRSYSPEFLFWCQRHNVPAVTTQLPIANAIDIEKHLTYYRTVLYQNSLAANTASIVIH